MSELEGVAGAEPVVIDTMIAGALISRRALAAKYDVHLAGRPLVVSFITVAELRFGALKAGWGATRIESLESRLSAMTVVPSDSDLADAYAELRLACHRAGHGLQQKNHEADRWIAATAVRFGLPLVSDDSIFDNVPGLVNIRIPS
ncbi:type II toxin-antitoxin system VapC family toxin [Nocardioides sp. HDW12B]|uniref:PIN domain-containing protein n=1 Tax=Nocardioides sp. HDW12B TaxID=2714939 RepID=UPI0014080D93|nr:PIN domain-containing protein [Nocardioides sp. HDW12B]QIK66285.1 type II toxin-antitoxin system VapC family toxin [Nocardioides sp. HDW12B]